MTDERSRRDVTAYSDLVTARSKSLFHTAYLMVGDHQLAQDLLQESLVKTYVAWPRLRDVNKAEAYTRRTIINTAISWRRRRSFHERPVDVLPEVGVADRVDELATRDALWAQLHLLSPRQRAAIVLRYFHDLSEAQAADAMGCSVGAVKSQTSAGIRRLRDRMGPEVALFTTTDQRMRP
jgi:RNA polymerase sigma-70 factor (sigma-E family)